MPYKSLAEGVGEPAETGGCSASQAPHGQQRTTQDCKHTMASHACHMRRLRGFPQKNTATGSQQAR